jgi:5-formyltetrahydrofolate cyclo-ligase
MISKSELRAEIQKKLVGLELQVFHQAGLQALEHLKGRVVAPVGIFKSRPREIDTQPWREYFTSALLPGPDPEAYAQVLLDAGVKTLFVPGLAFDMQGGRLGRGGGYYDRCIAALRRSQSAPQIIGLCLQEQVVPKVPMETHDQKMDILLSPLGMALL